jgi:hypothetical protein
MKQTPAGITPLAESINSAKCRWQAIVRVADVWRKSDPAGLQSYPGTSNFSDAQKRRLLKARARKK